MKLEEAIDILNEEKESKKHALEISGALRCDGYLEEKFRNEIQAYETVLQEIERLQKENEELISEKTKLLLTDLVEANKLYDEENKRCMMFAIENNDLKEKLDNSISKDKIREKIEKLEYKMKKYTEHSMEYYENVADSYAINILQDLLKEE